MQGESRVTLADVNGTAGLVELSPDGVVVSDHTRIRFVNSAGVRLAGASSPEELVGRSLLDFVDPQMHPVVQERLEAVMKGRAVAPLVCAAAPGRRDRLDRGAGARDPLRGA